MLKRIVMSILLAAVISGLVFYLAFFAGLIYSAATGPLNPANARWLQASLRHIALPISIALGVVTFIVAFRRGRRAPEKNLAKVVTIR